MLRRANDVKTVASWIHPPTSMSIHAGRHSVFLPVAPQARGWVNNEQLMSAQANLTGHNRTTVPDRMPDHRVRGQAAVLRESGPTGQMAGT